MKSTIHPKYNTDTQVTCSCGNTFTTGSTLDSIQVDICSACHPFFTGEMKFIDTQGRVERFEAIRKRAQELQKNLKQKKKAELSSSQEPQTLKEMMANIQKAS